MIELHIGLYPRLVIDGVEQPLKLKRGWAVLVFLAERGHKVSREHLAALLWPEVAAPLGRGRLRRLVHELNAALGRDLLVGDADALWLVEAGASATSDVVAIRHSARAIVAAAGMPSAIDVERVLAVGAARYLEGFSVDAEPFMEWMEQQRADHERLVMRALQRVAEHASHRGDADVALAAAERLIALDRCGEAGHAARLVALGRKGDGAAVEAAYFDCAQALREELGIRPSFKLEAEYALAIDLLARPGGEPRAAEVGSPDIRFAESSDGCVAYTCVGSGAQTVLVVPDLFSHLEVAFEDPRLRHCIGELASRYRLVLLDRRGTGLSERIGVRPDAETTLEDMTAVLDALAVERAWIFGESVGGPLAIEFAATRPQRTLGLLLYGSHARGSWAPDYPWAMATPALEKWLTQLHAEWGNAPSLGLFAPSSAADPQVRAWWARMLRQSTSRQGVEALLMSFHRIDVRHRLAALRTPTLVVHREDDRIVRAGAARYLAAAIPGARLVLLPGADHWFWHGDAEPVLQEMHRFIERHSAPAPP
ncbi:MAG: alpha/beta fold hydrolase [Burkholderiales bacterium]|nr:alpha/beta fold hydrolase [Burkholderiales bacterium]